MIFMWAFIVLCVLTVKNTRAIRKLKRRLDSCEAALTLSVTQSPAAAPAHVGGECVTDADMEVIQ